VVAAECGAEEIILNLLRAAVLLGAAAPALAQYAGPAILLRGEAPATMQGAELDFRPFLSISGGYTSGLSGVSVNPNGNTVNDSSSEIQVRGGVSGNHAWKRVKLGLDYHGSVRHDPKYSYFDATDQSLSLGITDRLTRHATLTLRENAGLMSNNFSTLALNPALPFDPATAYIPTSDFYDNRTIYLSTQADLTLQRSARLSFNFGGDGFLQRRRSSALYGVTGAAARADMQYRLSRRSTIGLGYTYTHYSFTGIFSSTDLHGVVISYGLRLSRNLEFTSYGGFMRAETKFVQVVPLDPAIAALLGLSAVKEVAYGISNVPNVSGRLSYAVQRGVFFISGGHSVVPGNGVFLTSTSTHAGGGYTYTARKRWSINTGVEYNRANSLGNVVGAYGGYTGTAGISRQLFRGTHVFLNAFANRYNSPDFRNYNRWTYSFQFGFAFAPGDLALRLW
jgi:hypothetical protein